MAFTPSQRGAIPPFLVMELLDQANARARRGLPVYHLEIGQPSTPAPQKVLAAAQRLLHEDVLGYTGALGVEALRVRIAEDYRQRYGCVLDAERVVVTAGSLGAFQLTLMACFERGDRVALCRPSYPSYRHLLRLLDLEPVFLDLPHDIALNWDCIATALGSTKLHGLLLANPDNPTGRMLTPEQLREIAEQCHERGIRLIVDEIYHGLIYDIPDTPVWALSPSAISVNSFSKYYSMTGWRLGWMVVPQNLLKSVACLAQNLFICPNTLAQKAAVYAFDCRDELDGHVRRYRANRDRLREKLPELGFTSLARGDGAFYLYASVTALTSDSRAFCQALLETTGVAITPGWDFDDQRGGEFVRLSYAGETQDIDAAIEALKTFFHPR